MNVSRNTAKSWAKREDIQAEIQSITNRVAKRTEATIEDAISEVDEAIAFSRLTDNANAMVRALEHKHKLQGFITDGRDQGAGGSHFHLHIEGVRPAEPVEVQVFPDPPALPTAPRAKDEIDEEAELAEIIG